MLSISCISTLSPADHQIITIDLGLQFVHRLATVSLVISLQHEWSTHQTLVTRGVIGHTQQDDVVLARLVLYLGDAERVRPKSIF